MSCCFRTKLIFSDPASFKTSFSFGKAEGFSFTFAESGGRHQAYEGAYEVEPRFTEQELLTQGLLMRENVSVHAIRVHSVSNPQGGRTVTIGTP